MSDPKDSVPAPGDNGEPVSPNSLSLAVLSMYRSSYSVRRILEEGRARGHRIRAFDPTAFSILVEQDQPRLFYRGKPAPQIDGVIPRIGASITHFGTTVVRQFEQMGVFCINTSHAINSSRDKLHAMQVLSRHRIGMPRTAFVTDRLAVKPAIDHVGGAPVVLKLLEATQGIGVILADHAKTAEAIVEALHSAKQNVLIQNFVSESRGRDIRAFVVDGEVVAAMRRTASGDEFRSNLHRGGTSEGVELDDAYRRAAVRAAQVLGLRVAGVDLLEGKDGPQIIEVNSSPGLEGIERASGVNIASVIIDCVERYSAMPEVDIRQRLTVQAGYGIVEVRIDPKGSFVGKTIESIIEVQDSAVLTVARGEEVIPIPARSLSVEAGDVLLCFGPTKALRALVPARGKKRRKPRRIE